MSAKETFLKAADTVRDAAIGVADYAAEVRQDLTIRFMDGFSKVWAKHMSIVEPMQPNETEQHDEQEN